MWCLLNWLTTVIVSGRCASQRQHDHRPVDILSTLYRSTRAANTLFVYRTTTTNREVNEHRKHHIWTETHTVMTKWFVFSCPWWYEFQVPSNDEKWTKDNNRTRTGIVWPLRSRIKHQSFYRLNACFHLLNSSQEINNSILMYLSINILYFNFAAIFCLVSLVDIYCRLSIQLLRYFSVFQMSRVDPRPVEIYYEDQQPAVQCNIGGRSNGKGKVDCSF